MKKILFTLLIICSGFTTEKKQIALLFYNNCEPRLHERMAAEISRFYKARVYVIPPASLPGSAFYKPRNRYRAEVILDNLAKNYAQYSNIMAFTDKDISTTAHGVYDWGICGLGSVGEGSSITSTFRLKKGSPEAIDNKILNTALHEIGHGLGLEHCSNPACLMRDAEGHLSPADSEAPYMCPHCLSLIK